MSDLIVIGYITKAFGIKGGVTLKLLNEDSQSIKVGKSLILNRKSLPYSTVQVGDIISGNRVFFEGINNRTAAEELKGSQVLIYKSELPAIEDDEYYLSDLLGAKIIDTDQNLIGELVGYSSNNAQLLFEIKTPNGKAASIPCVKPLIQKIDYENKLVIADPPMGLLSLEE